MGVIPSDYRYMRSIRVLAVLTVWVPILAYVQGVLPTLPFRLLVLNMAVAFYLRALDFREGRLSDKSILPGFMYSMGMLAIAAYRDIWYSVGTLLSGAYLISTHRNIPSLYIDWIGRVAFAGGFTSFLYYL